MLEFTSLALSGQLSGIIYTPHSGTASIVSFKRGERLQNCFPAGNKMFHGEKHFSGDETSVTTGEGCAQKHSVSPLCRGFSLLLKPLILVSCSLRALCPLCLKNLIKLILTVTYHADGACEAHSNIKSAENCV